VHLGACPSNGGIFGTNWFRLSMSRHFRPLDNYQTQFLATAVVDDVPADYLAQFVVVLAREHLDLSEIVASCKAGLVSLAFRPQR
jgi:hypothetical protein